MSISKKLMTTGATEDTYVEDVFSTTLYVGDGVTQTVTTGIDVLDKGGLIWTGQRTNGGGYNLIDSARGSSYSLDTVSTNPTSFNETQLTFLNDGYRINNGSPAWDLNQTNLDYVAWSWQKQPSFFDVVTYTGTGVAGDVVIPHSLGVEPGMVIVKDSSNSGAWYVWHKTFSNPLDDYMILNQTNSTGNSSGIWGTSGATSTSFSIQGNGSLNTLDNQYVAYLFAHDDSDESLIKCGSYTGNGSTAAVEVDLGFEPQWVLVKNASPSGGAQNWHIMDSVRGWPGATSSTTGGTTEVLKPNLSNEAESSAGYYGWITSNGFSMYETNVSNPGTTYIYMAIRRPNKPAEEFEPEELFAISPRTDGPGKYPYFSGFPVDMGITRKITDPTETKVGSRLSGQNLLITNGTDAEYIDSNNAWDDIESVALSYKTLGAYPQWLTWMWRRAPGFFDVVTYEGSQTVRDIPHSLGVAPEMMWVKCRSQARNWMVYAEPATADYSAILNDSGGFFTDSQGWNNTAPTSTHFTVGSSASTNFGSEQMIAYLFASVPGISKVGSYTGTAALLEIDCGFTNGARFVLIKRTDVSGGWYLFDSVRGISSDNDPFIDLSSTGSQTTSLNLVEPLSGGFSLRADSSNYPIVNTNGGEYIYMAIA